MKQSLTNFQETVPFRRDSLITIQRSEKSVKKKQKIPHPYKKILHFIGERICLNNS